MRCLFILFIISINCFAQTVGPIITIRKGVVNYCASILSQGVIKPSIPMAISEKLGTKDEVYRTYELLSFSKNGDYVVYKLSKDSSRVIIFNIYSTEDMKLVSSFELERNILGSIKTTRTTLDEKNGLVLLRVENFYDMGEDAIIVWDFKNSQLEKVYKLPAATSEGKIIKTSYSSVYYAPLDMDQPYIFRANIQYGQNRSSIEMINWHTGEAIDLGFIPNNFWTSASEGRISFQELSGKYIYLSKFPDNSVKLMMRSMKDKSEEVSLLTVTTHHELSTYGYSEKRPFVAGATKGMVFVWKSEPLEPVFAKPLPGIETFKFYDNQDLFVVTTKKRGLYVFSMQDWTLVHHSDNHKYQLKTVLDGKDSLYIVNDNSQQTLTEITKNKSNSSQYDVVEIPFDSDVLSSNFKWRDIFILQTQKSEYLVYFNENTKERPDIHLYIHDLSNGTLIEKLYYSTLMSFYDTNLHLSEVSLPTGTKAIDIHPSSSKRFQGLSMYNGENRFIDLVKLLEAKGL